MRKPSEDFLNVVELSDTAKEILKDASASSNPSDALKQLVTLFKGKIILRCEAVEYSRSTGKPTRFAWKPFQAWDGNLWLNSCGSGSLSLDRNSALYEPLLSYLPVGKTTVVEVGKDKFVIRHVPARSEIGGTTPNYIEFTQAI